MANTLIQPQYLSLNGKRIAFVTGSSVDIASNDERQVALEGVVGHSDGVPFCDFEIKTIVAITGSDDATIIGILINKEYCEIEATIGSQSAVVTCRCVTFSGNSEAQSGKFEGSYKFESSGQFTMV
jgi:hypothetical protein